MVLMLLIAYAAIAMLGCCVGLAMALLIGDKLSRPTIGNFVVSQTGALGTIATTPGLFSAEKLWYCVFALFASIVLYTVIFGVISKYMKK